MGSLFLHLFISPSSKATLPICALKGPRVRPHPEEGPGAPVRVSIYIYICVCVYIYIFAYIFRASAVYISYTHTFYVGISL